jgi:hypothetical protein
MTKSEEIQATFLPVVQIVSGKRSALGCRSTEARSSTANRKPGDAESESASGAKIGMVQRKRRRGNTFDGSEIVEWVQLTGGKAGYSELPRQAPSLHLPLSPGRIQCLVSGRFRIVRKG